MSFLILLLGVALWWASHLFKRVFPDLRASLGAPGKGLVAIGLLASIWLMYKGYAPGDGPIWWGRSAALVGINNLLMVGAVFLYAADGMRAPIIGRMRHPQLTGFALWALAHLVVNGDLASFILFGGLLTWALAEIVIINRAQPDWTPKPVKEGRNKTALIGTAVGVVAIMVVHWLLGVTPWGA